MELHKDIKDKRTITRFKTLEEDFRKVHGDRYDYSLVVYYSVRTKVKIICPIHGEFEQQVVNHLSGSKCPSCAKEDNKSNTEEFIEKAKLVHGDKYDYSLVEYSGTLTKVKIICPVHGGFVQTPNGHIGRRGCPKCSGVYRPSTKEWIEKAKLVHGNKYDYSLVEYINARTKVKIICPIHGVFEQIPNSHLIGKACPSCAKEDNSLRRSYYKNKRTLLYYLKVETENQTLYKIGITTRSVNKRYNDEISNCTLTILKEIWYEDGALAFDEEKRIIKENRKYKYKGEKVFKYTGITEMFTKDVL